MHAGVHTPSGGLKLLDVAALESGTPPQDTVVWEIAAHNGPVPWAIFSPDGSLIASLGLGDSQLRVWDSQDGELVADFGKMGGSFPMFSFHPDGIHLAAEDTGGTIQILTLDSNELVAIATSRLTRGFTQDECATYGIDPCPTLEDIRSGSA